MQPFDPLQDDALASVAGRPAMEWYSEHVRTVAGSGGEEGELVRLSGHNASLNESRAALEAVGWEFEILPLDGSGGIGGTSPADPAGPAVVLLDHGPTTFMLLLSYELTVEEVRAFAGSVEAVDETTWDESDGVIR